MKHVGEGDSDGAQVVVLPDQIFIVPVARKGRGEERRRRRRARRPRRFPVVYNSIVRSAVAREIWNRNVSSHSGVSVLEMTAEVAKADVHTFTVRRL